MDKNDKNDKYQTGNKFFILQDFNDDLRDGIVIPLTKKIDELEKVKDARIDIYINSHGGDGHLCLTIINLLELAKSKGITIRTIITQIAYSAGSLVAIAGSKGERYIAETAEHCVHYGTQYGWAEKTPLQIERNTEEKKRWFATLLNTYKKYCEIPDLEEQLKDDSYFITAADSIKFKMADKYMGEL